MWSAGCPRTAGRDGGSQPIARRVGDPDPPSGRTTRRAPAAGGAGLLAAFTRRGRAGRCDARTVGGGVRRTATTPRSGGSTTSLSRTRKLFADCAGRLDGQPFLLDNSGGTKTMTVAAVVTHLHYHRGLVEGGAPWRSYVDDSTGQLVTGAITPDREQGGLPPGHPAFAAGAGRVEAHQGHVDALERRLPGRSVNQSGPLNPTI